MRWFEEQLELAVELKKPVFLHERAAHDAFVRILEPYMPKLAGAVVHGFTGTDAELKKYLSMGCHIGITGWICDERRGTELAKIVHQIPLDRLMVGIFILFYFLFTVVMQTNALEVSLHLTIHGPPPPFFFFFFFFFWATTD